MAYAIKPVEVTECKSECAVPQGTINPEWVRTCLRLSMEEFTDLCKKLYGPVKVESYADGGIYFTPDSDFSGDDEDFEDNLADRLGNDLSAYFGLTILSFHTDEVGDVWINYIPVEEKPKCDCAKHNWYRISADGGNSWTEQYLTMDDVIENLSLGYMLVKSKRL